MSTFPWKVSGKSASRSGVVEATSDREALAKVLGGAVDLGFSPKGDESYSITVGPLTTSAYGDEFDRVAGAHSIDETDLDMSQGHLFNDPVLERLADKGQLDIKDAQGRPLAPVPMDDPDFEEPGKDVRNCRSKFDNQENFGGFDPYVTPEKADEYMRGIFGAGIQPPNQPRQRVNADPDQWSLDAHQDVDYQHAIGHLGAPRAIVTQVRKSISASFSGAAARAIEEAAKNQDEVEIVHTLQDGSRMVARFIPYNSTRHSDGSIDVEGPVTHDEFIEH